MALHNTDVYRSDLSDYMAKRNYHGDDIRKYCDDLMGRSGDHVSLAVLLDSFFGAVEAARSGNPEPAEMAVTREMLRVYLVGRGYAEEAAVGCCDDVIGVGVERAPLTAILDGLFGAIESLQPVEETVDGIQPMERPDEEAVAALLLKRSAGETLKRFLKTTLREIGLSEALMGSRVVASKAEPGQWELEIHLFGKRPLGVSLPKVAGAFPLHWHFKAVG